MTYAGLLRNFVESYRIAARGLSGLKSGPLDSKELVKQTLATGRMMYLSGEVERLQRIIAGHAKHVDPLEKWYELVGFVAVSQKKKLEDDALLAQSLYSMEHMLRLFYEDLTGNRL